MRAKSPIGVASPNRAFREAISGSSFQRWGDVMPGVTKPPFLRIMDKRSNLMPAMPHQGRELHPRRREPRGN
jgi:hypothetical protein